MLKRGAIQNSAAAVSGFARVVAFDAGDGAEVLIDGAEIVVRELAEVRPGHDLQQVAIEWFGNAVRVDGIRCTRRVKVIVVDSCADDGDKLFEGAAALGETA